MNRESDGRENLGQVGGESGWQERKPRTGWRKVGMAGDRTSDRFDVFRASLEKHRAAICGGIVRWHVMVQGKTSYVLQKILFG